jgi:hypothetical protein
MALMQLKIKHGTTWIDALIPIQVITSYIDTEDGVQITLVCGNTYTIDKTFDEITRLLKGSPIATPR